MATQPPLSLPKYWGSDGKNWGRGAKILGHHLRPLCINNNTIVLSITHSLLFVPEGVFPEGVLEATSRQPEVQFKYRDNGLQFIRTIV